MEKRCFLASIQTPYPSIVLSCWVFPGSWQSVLITIGKKGGRFRVKEELRKIYGLSEQLYNMVYGYIDLPDSTSFSALKKHQFSIDINIADGS